MKDDEGILTLESHVALNSYILPNWDDVMKKEARGIDEGEVHDLDADNVVTKRGIVDKDKFYLPKNRAVRFDGHKVWFNVTKDQAKAFKKE